MRIVESALLLFSRDGIDNVSVRDLTAHADVNLSAVNYHFGSKEGLAKVVFEELSKRVNHRRLDDLDALLRKATEERRSPRLEDVVESFIRPYVGTDDFDEGLLLARLILQHRASPTDLTSQLMRKHFDPMAKKYIAALAAACPDVPEVEFFWRYTFMTGAVVMAMTDRQKKNRLVKLSGGAVDASNTDAFRTALMRFLCGGLRAEFVPLGS